MLKDLLACAGTHIDKIDIVHIYIYVGKLSDLEPPLYQMLIENKCLLEKKNPNII